VVEISTPFRVLARRADDGILKYSEEAQRSQRAKGHEI